MHVLTVVGARPQFVKAFPVSRALRDRHDETLVHTGQHYDHGLSDVFFEELDVPEPDHHLGIGSASPGEQIGRMMEALQPIVDDEEPDVVLVYGDTNSTLAAATVAAHGEPILAHVEAGLRSYNRSMPEEVNRVLTDHAANILFAPTERAVRALQTEGISTGVYQTGDVMVDALQWARQVADKRTDVLETLGLARDEYILATVHRQSNTDDIERLRTIFASLGALDRPVVLPAHPRTIDRLEEADALDWAKSQVTIIEPLGYLDFITALTHAWRAVTDSGGVQKEAFLLDTPCVTLRAETEWPETVEAGWNRLVGDDLESLQDAVTRPYVIENKPHPFGDGNAAVAIRRHLEDAITDTHNGGCRQARPPRPDYQRGN